MPSPIDDRRPPITPQLAVRVAVLGGFAFVLFAVIFFRLWFLQVLTGDDYVVQARENRVRKVKIEAPRGNIVDRDGRTLVKTRAAPVVQILRELERLLHADGRDSTKAERGRVKRLRAAARRAEKVPVGPIPAEPQLRSLYRRLGKVLGISPMAIHRRVIQGIADQPSANVTT